MADLTFDEVAALAKSIGLHLQGEDLVEVTHRLNVTLSGMEGISNVEHNEVTPLTFPRPEEGAKNGA